jgi:hypothetical protein
MREIYRRLASNEQALVWATLGVALIAGFVWVFRAADNSAGIVATAQVAAALGTLALAVLALRQVEELRATRIGQERPQVIVDLAFRQQLAYVVVRNIGSGAAKEIRFDFSAPLETPDGDLVNELPYFSEGIDYLAPGSELSTLWDSMITLKTFLDEHGATRSITITSRYKSLSDDRYQTEWTINPLRLIGMTPMGDATMRELVSAIKDMRKDINKVINVHDKALMVTTATERERQRAETRRDIEQLRKERKDNG